VRSILFAGDDGYFSAEEIPSVIRSATRTDAAVTERQAGR